MPGVTGKTCNPSLGEVKIPTEEPSWTLDQPCLDYGNPEILMNFTNFRYSENLTDCFLCDSVQEEPFKMIIYTCFM